MESWREILRSWALPLGGVGGVPLKVHASFLLVFLAALVASAGSAAWSLLVTVCVFVLVLLHEVGHLVALRMADGYVEESLLWPLGGLSDAELPLKPLTQFGVAAAGPLTHLLVALAFLPWLLTNGAPPFLPAPGANGIQTLLSVNQFLLVVNVLPVLGTDGGRLWQTLLWHFLGYGRATYVTLMAGALCGTAFLALGALWRMLPLAVAGACVSFATLYYRASVRLAEDVDGMTVEVASYFRGGYRRRRFLSRWRHWLGKRRQEREHTQRAHEALVLDELLAKIKSRGMAALTDDERKFLEKQSSKLQGR
jgi:hypothetical protein